MLKNIYFILVLILISSFSFGQSAKVLKRPVEYLRPDGYVFDTHDSKVPKKGGEDWAVFSDRNDNIVYSAPNGGAEAGRIKFGEVFYVTGTEGEWLELYTIESGKAKSKVGWIHKSKILLWNTAIRKKGFTVKVLAMIKDLSVLGNAGEYISREGEGSVYCYDRPIHDKKYQNGKKLGLFQLMFKMKEENDMVLLAYDAFFSSYTSDAVIGWVPKAVINEWEYRLTVEPNYSQTARTQRSVKGVKLPVFKLDAKDNAVAYAKEGVPAPQSSVLQFKSEFESVRSEEMRMPLLDGNKGYDIKSNLYHVGYISPVFSKGNKQVMSQRSIDSLRSEIDKTTIPYQNVNFIFMVDGSNSMKPAMAEIKRAIQQLKVDISEDLKKEFNFTFSCVIYRANDDKSCGDAPVSRIDFTPNVNKIYEWIDKETSKNNCSSFKPNQGSFLREGLLESFKMIKQSKRQEESNYLILIGGPGDSEINENNSALSLDNLSKQYAECGINLFAYQYLSGKDKVYNYFYDDLTDLMDKGAAEMYKLIEKDSKKEKLESLRFSKIESQYIRRYISDTASTGFIRFAELNGPSQGVNLNGQFFQEDMNQLITRITNFQVSKVSHLRGMLSGIITPDTTMQLDASLLYMTKNIKNISEVMDFFRGTNFQYITPGWVPKSHKAVTEDLFIRSLFFTSNELSDLMGDIRSFSSGSDDPNAFRDKAYFALRALTSKYLGEISNDQQISGKMLFESFVGVNPPPINIFSQITDIEDLRNVRKIDITQIEELRKSAKKWLSDLDVVQMNPNYQWKRGKIVYYWVPEAVFGSNKSLE
jgi:hypothetical protein